MSRLHKQNIVMAKALARKKHLNAHVEERFIIVLEVIANEESSPLNKVYRSTVLQNLVKGTERYQETEQRLLKEGVIKENI